MFDAGNVSKAGNHCGCGAPSQVSCASEELHHDFRLKGLVIKIHFMMYNYYIYIYVI